MSNRKKPLTALTQPASVAVNIQYVIPVKSCRIETIPALSTQLLFFFSYRRPRGNFFTGFDKTIIPLVLLEPPGPTCSVLFGARQIV
jgi:hypothetical protein